MILEGHSGGVTQIKFHPDGNLLLSGARKVSQAVTRARARRYWENGPCFELAHQYTFTIAVGYKN